MVVSHMKSSWRHSETRIFKQSWAGARSAGMFNMLELALVGERSMGNVAGMVFCTKFGWILSNEKKENTVWDATLVINDNSSLTLTVPQLLRGTLLAVRVCACSCVFIRNYRPCSLSANKNNYILKLPRIIACVTMAMAMTVTMMMMMMTMHRVQRVPRKQMQHMQPPNRSMIMNIHECGLESLIRLFSSDYESGVYVFQHEPEQHLVRSM